MNLKFNMDAKTYIGRFGITSQRADELVGILLGATSTTNDKTKIFAILNENGANDNEVLFMIDTYGLYKSIPEEGRDDFSAGYRQYMASDELRKAQADEINKKESE